MSNNGQDWMDRVEMMCVCVAATSNLKQPSFWQP